MKVYLDNNSSTHLTKPMSLHESSLHVLAGTWLSGAVIEWFKKKKKKVKCDLKL